MRYGAVAVKTMMADFLPGNVDERVATYGFWYEEEDVIAS